MKRSWQMVIRFRLVLAAISLIALLLVCWLSNVPTSDPANATTAAEMPVQTAVTLGNSVTQPSQEIPKLKANPNSAAKEVPPPEPLETSTLQEPAQQNSETITINPNLTVKDAMAAPTVQSNQVSSFETTNPFTGPKQTLINGKGSKLGEQF